MSARVQLHLIVDVLKAEMQEAQLQQKERVGTPQVPSCCACPDLAQEGPNSGCKHTLAAEGKI